MVKQCKRNRVDPASGCTIHLNGSSSATGLKSQIVGNRITTQVQCYDVNYDPNLNMGSPNGPVLSGEVAQKRHGNQIPCLSFFF